MIQYDRFSAIWTKKGIKYCNNGYPILVGPPVEYQ